VARSSIRNMRVTLIAFILAALPAAPAAAVPPAPAVATHAMVVSAQHLATEVGVEILRRGGNAVDAAVAVGYALAVVDPCCGNLGGGGFMTLHLANGRNAFLDFRETAPLAATRDMFVGPGGEVDHERSLWSYQAVGVPGTVKGFDAALARYGTLPRATVMAPAIRLAGDGFVLGRGDAAVLARAAERLARDPSARRIFFPDGSAPRTGERLRQPDLAGTLELVAREGSRAFYDGPIARRIVAASRAHGGLLALRDFRSYRAVWRAPIVCRYRGYTVVSAPPPSSGGVTLCEMLGVLGGWPRFAAYAWHAVPAVHDLVEAMRFAFADRNRYLGDPDFVRNPVARLLSPQHAAWIRSRIPADRAVSSSRLRGSLAAVEGRHTTHYSIVDAHGNAVAVTYTINSYFGSGHVAPGTGFLLNNEMNDFTAKPGVPNQFGLVQGAANAIAPGKRPLSSMTPTLLLRGGRVFMVTGSPGGPTIITTVLQTIVNVVDRGMNVQQAVDAPRIHQQWLPDLVFTEPGALSAVERAALGKMGYRFAARAQWGAAEAIVARDGRLAGANDRRRPEGLAAGY
jgi:gamma-glutamyltranspeptidase/glutathione hydrolase